MPRPGAARSFWLQEALTHDPGEPTPPLEANVTADACIVGGGFAGLWTAVRLTERAPGMRIVILEQDIVGGGASGRNGGFASSVFFGAQPATPPCSRAGGLRSPHAPRRAVLHHGSCWMGH